VKRLALALLLCCPASLHGQTPYFEAGRFFADTATWTWRAGITSRLAGPIGFGLDATLLSAESGLPAQWGGEADLSLFRGGSPGWYLVGAYAGGINSGGSSTWWHGWSAGVGYELFPVSWATLAFEGRWRVQQPGERQGVELGVRLGIGGADHHHGYSAAPSAAPSTSIYTRPGTTEARDQIIAGVIATAKEAMGTPYKWGGEGSNGFDCSGLIQYAYGSQGIALPRRSVDQAREGQSIDRSIDVLLPGDILAFSSSGNGQVSHVGLYVGDGQFIHSASSGVQISRLSPDDSYGKWWWQRWVGVRRIVAVPGT
jgi:cell wall-associated NlpC family hydrolase